MRKKAIGMFALSLVVAALLGGCGSNDGYVAEGIENVIEENITEHPEEPPQDPSVLTMDEKGLVTWSAVPDAVGYEYDVARDGTSYENGTLPADATSFQLPQGYCLYVRPVYADGSTGDWAYTETYGVYVEPEEPVVPTEAPQAVLAITVDENGYATWNVMPDAVGYEYELSRNEIAYGNGRLSADTTGFQIPQGCRLYVSPVYADGSTGDWVGTETYGVYVEPTEAPVEPDVTEPSGWEYYEERVDQEYSVLWENLSRMDIISNLKQDTVKNMSDGTVYFEAARPDGKTVGFFGTGISITEEGITMEPGGRIVSADAIGRICAYDVVVDTTTDFSAGDLVGVGSAYTFTDETQVESMEELCTNNSFLTGVADNIGGEYQFTMMDHQPNFAVYYAPDWNQESFTVSGLSVYYDETTYTTAIVGIGLEETMYGAYLEGERYYIDKETQAVSEENLYNFYLIAVPELKDELVPKSVEERMQLNSGSAVCFIEKGNYTVGVLKGAQGNVLEKETAKVYPGTTLEVTVGDYTEDVELPTVARFEGATTMHDLIPYAFPEAKGTLNVLVVPIAWQDEPENATDNEWNMFRDELGRVMDEDGTVTDYSAAITAQNRFSFSEYYDIASYGNLNIQSFLTEWYEAPYDFAQMSTEAPGTEFMDEVMDWLYKTYPDMDWTRFDQDANGYFDSVVLLNSGNLDGGYTIGSYAAGIMIRNSNTAEKAGTTERPEYNAFLSVHADLLKGNTLIHEFGHVLGLKDYYDTSFSGIDAVGRYDMMSANVGDWNSYSKYAVGWITPEIVDNLKSGESVDIEIGAFATTGDAIVIPAAGSADGGVFSEYIMVDLFTDDGVNKYDAKKFMDGDPEGLGDAVGVRIYHVNAHMEKQTITEESGKQYTVGFEHTLNRYDTSGYGKYLIELIQAGGKNTFTSKDSDDVSLAKDDLFGEGDVFTAEGYSEFFYEGNMDSGEAFGYEIKILSIETGEEPTAVIRITRK